MEDVTYQTNLYAEQFFSVNLEKLSNLSRMRRFVGGTSVERMKVFIALQYYREDKEYWSIDEMMSTPFVRKISSRDDFQNMLSLILLCDNATYPKKNTEGYDPRRKTWQHVYIVM